MALKIQHSFFKCRAGLRTIVSGKKLPKRTLTSKYSKSTSRLNGVNKSKSSAKFSSNNSRKDITVKDDEYERQATEKQERQKRISEARKCNSSKASSRTGTAEKTEKVKKSKLQIVKQPTITDEELQKVVSIAWNKAETEKQKQLKQTCKSKKAPLKNQNSDAELNQNRNSINEETLVNNIVSKAWVNAEKTKIHDELKKRNPKPPVLHSQESINEAKLVSNIVQTAWKTVNEDQKKSASKIPKVKKQPIKSQDSVNEERLVGKILNEAFEKAEELKKQTVKARKQAEHNRTKPKMHRAESIQEELVVKKIVNNAWNEVQKENLDQSIISKGRLANINENDMECESSFDGSESDSDNKHEDLVGSPIVEERQTRKSIVNNENKPTECRKVRRSRANRKNSSDKVVDQVKSPSNPMIQVSPIKKSPFKESSYSNM